MAIKSNDTSTCEAPLAKMIEEFRVAKQRQLVRRAMALWNRAEAEDALSVIRQPWLYDSKASAGVKVPAAVTHLHKPGARRPGALFDTGESDCDRSDPLVQDGGQPEPGNITPR